MKYFWLCIFVLAVTSARAQIAVLKEDAALLYEKPSTQSRLLAVLSAGDTVQVLKKQGSWAQLRFRTRRIGWMQLRHHQGRNGATVSNGANGEIQYIAENQLAVSERNAGFATQAPVSRKQPPVDGGLSLGLGVFGGDFSYIGRFFYRNLRTLYLEGTFQYVAGQIASQYLMHANARYVRPINSRFSGYATAGVGVINTVPIQSAGAKSVSNMAFNYGLGVARQLKSNNWLRADLRQFTLPRRQGTVNFIEFTIGLDIGIRWSKL
jgi:opacity protein-like surface antigen